jgi:hypothetical protein
MGKKALRIYILGLSKAYIDNFKLNRRGKMNTPNSNIQKNNSSFRNSGTYQYLRKVKMLRRIRAAYKGVISNFTPKYPFHKDIFMQKIFFSITHKIEPTSIVETGTFLGTSTAFMAKTSPNIPVYTCEINEINYKKSKKNLRRYSNVRIIKDNSPRFLQNMADKKLFGDLPVFFLDAHWWNYWPLEDEIKIITDRCKSAIILIDDFKVNDATQFVFDNYGPRACSLDLIKPKMNKKNKYNLLFPNYNMRDFPQDKLPQGLTGYPIIFMNLQKEFKEFSSEPFVKKYFKDRSDLFPKEKKQK